MESKENQDKSRHVDSYNDPVVRRNQQQRDKPGRKKQTNAEKNPTTGQTVEIFGPTLEFLTSPEDERNDFCVLRGIIPPNVYIPLHSHPETEDFLLVSGTVEYLRQDGKKYEWVSAKPGDYVHVPPDAPHAWRNTSPEPVVNLIITTKRLARFFQEAGRRPTADASQPVKPEDLARFAEISVRYGHWIATPEENEAVGIPSFLKE